MVYLHGRGLPLEDEALYYTLRFPLYHRHSPYLPPDPIPNYLYIFIYKGEDLAWGVLHVAGRGLPMKNEHSTILYGFPCTTVIPHTYQFTYA